MRSLVSTSFRARCRHTHTHSQTLRAGCLCSVALPPTFSLSLSPFHTHTCLPMPLREAREFSDVFALFSAISLALSYLSHPHLFANALEGAEFRDVGVIKYIY